MTDELITMIICVFFGVMFGTLIGGCIEQKSWKEKLRNGHGPEIIRMIQLEDEAYKISKELEKQ